MGVDHVVGLRILSGSSAFTIAGLSAHRTGGHKRGLQVLREGCKRLPRIGFARKGRITYLLQGLSFFVTLGLGTPAGRRWHAGLRRAPWERGRVARAGRPPPTEPRTGADGPQWASVVSVCWSAVARRSPRPLGFRFTDHKGIM